MGLYERLLGTDPLPRLSIHAFQAIAAEWGRGSITGAQAQTAITATCGVALTAAEVTEAQTLVNTIPTGSTTANKADRAVRLQEIDQVLLMAGLPPYTTAAAIKTRLGV